LYADREIYERDGWRCHLCGRRIFKSKRWPDPKSGTIDHIVPLSEGGIDEPANVAAAHWDCNREKRARALGEQLRLN
jgi:5-methylcytosine-specific restriction endonuclease McrA